MLQAVLERGAYLLDIGAYDGITFSNSLALIEFGWHGVLVEPSPIPFDALLKRHGRNEHLHLVHSLVGVEPKPFVPVWFTDDAVSTTEKSNHDHWADYANYNPQCAVPQVTIPEILQHFALNPQFVNIDTEGTSVALFKSYPFDTSKPMCFAVEIDGDWRDLAAFADSKGYSVVYRNAENLVLVRR